MTRATWLIALTLLAAGCGVEPDPVDSPNALPTTANTMIRRNRHTLQRRLA